MKLRRSEDFRELNVIAEHTAILVDSFEFRASNSKHHIDHRESGHKVLKCKVKIGKISEYWEVNLPFNEIVICGDSDDSEI